MGADLCGYILVGPTKIARKDIDKAVEQAKGMKAVLKVAIPMLKKKEKAAGRPFSGHEVWESLRRIGEKSIAKLLKSDAKCYKRYVTLAIATDSEVKLIEEKMKEDVEKTIHDFAIMWNAPEGYHRDMMARAYVVNGADKRIVVVGDRTWGDGPEPGSAWYITDQAAWWCALTILGIE